MTDAFHNIRCRYVIVGMLRSGTTVTHHCLRGHPNVSALYSEVGVEPYFSQGVRLFSFGQGATSEEVAAGHRVLFDAAAGITADEHTTTLGMKVALATPRLARLFADALREHLPDVKVIFTLRGDLLAQYASFQRAQVLDQWHAFSDATRTAPTQITLGRYDFADYLIDGFEILNEVESLAATHDFLTFHYESDINGEAGVQASTLFDFLGLPDMEPTWLRSKKMSPPVSSYVANYDAMQALADEITARLSDGAAALRARYGTPTSRKLLSEAKRFAARTKHFARRVASTASDHV